MPAVEHVIAHREDDGTDCYAMRALRQMKFMDIGL